MTANPPRLRAALAALAPIAAALLLGAASEPAPARSAQPGVTITFLANEGVLLEGGGKRVLVDALFQKYETSFAVPSAGTQRALAAAQPPFAEVDLVLVTHRHGDHFHPAPVVAHLQADPGAVLLASAQVVDSLRGRLPADGSLAPRIQARTIPTGTRRRETVNGVTVELLGLRHHDLQHLGYVVEIGGRRVLHVGDTDDAAASFPPFRLDTMQIDVALLPHWMVRDRAGLRAVQRWVRPRQVVAFHVGLGEEARTLQAVAARLPGAVTFVRELDRLTW